MHNNRLSTIWTKHLKASEKKGFESAVRSSTLVLGRLKDILKEKVSQTSSKETRLDDYDTPSWSHKQAHRNGVLQSYKEILELLSFLDQQ